MKTTGEVIQSASVHLTALTGHVFDLLTISKPISPEAAVNLAKVVSKLSPLLGNLIEFNTVAFLNDQKEYQDYGQWKRQDPGFPDTIFSSAIQPSPGFEIKAWFPLATEITARFKDSQNHFLDDQTYVCLLAWLPDQLIYGKPTIIDVCIVSGMSVAKARDTHYHNPPDYLVMEPEDTTARTRNLQQTNTNGYKWQGTPDQFRDAQAFVASWVRNALPINRHQNIRPNFENCLRDIRTAWTQILPRSIESTMPGLPHSSTRYSTPSTTEKQYESGRDSWGGGKKPSFKKHLRSTWASEKRILETAFDNALLPEIVIRRIKFAAKGPPLEAMRGNAGCK